MIRNHIITQENRNNLFFLNESWSTAVPALVRVPFYDREKMNEGYVVTYSESEQKYHLLKLNTMDGSIIWDTPVTNGGYGTPVVMNGLVFVLKEFESIEAFDKKTGKSKWDLSTKHRVRTSLNVSENLVWYGSGSHIYGVDEGGNIVKSFHIPNSFLYGNISFYKKAILCLGTKYNERMEDSYAYLWLISNDGELMYSVELGESPVISSDTSGLWVAGDMAYATCEKYVICIDLNIGKEKWRTEVLGFAGRHFPIVQNDRVYYTTLRGELGCLETNSGLPIWKKKFQEGIIVSPPSIIGGTLFVLADCSIFAVDKNTGEIYQRKTIGHTPYSAATINGNRILVGGGEPPINGRILCFDVVEENMISPSKVMVKI